MVNSTDNVLNNVAIANLFYLILNNVISTRKRRILILYGENSYIYSFLFQGNMYFYFGCYYYGHINISYNIILVHDN